MGLFDFLRGKDKKDATYKDAGNAESGRHQASTKGENHVMLPATTKSPDTVVDADGNVYHTVKIGNQIWTAENFRTTKFRDGTPIPLIADEKEWVHSSAPAYCWYKNDIHYKNRYGALYNLHCVNGAMFPPEGWHVPTANEWIVLRNYLGSRNGKALAAKSDWEADAGVDVVGNRREQNNASGFSALPSGLRRHWGTFEGDECTCNWWAATADVNPNDTVVLILRSNSKDLERAVQSRQYSDGHSVRLLKGA